MAKSRDAFRTISEISEILDTPAHVLRFWESKFKQIKPVKRAGGRRYYRPDDLAIVAAIKDLLHSQGHSIKHAQKLMRDAGVKQVVADGYALLGTADGEAPAVAISQPVMPPPPKNPVVDDAQDDLFAGSESAPADPSPVAIPGADLIPDPIVSVEDNIFATRQAIADVIEENTPELETKAAALDLPPSPPARDDVQARILAQLVTADPDAIRANATQIAPLVARLTALRDEMRHQW